MTLIGFFIKKIEKNRTFQVNFFNGLDFGLFLELFGVLWKNFSAQHFAFENFVGSDGLSGSQVTPYNQVSTFERSAQDSSANRIC
jgi:hypothetical protein